MATRTETSETNPLAHLDGTVEVTPTETPEQASAREERQQVRRDQFKTDQDAREAARKQAEQDSETTASQVAETGVPAVQPASGIAEEGKTPPGTTHAATPRTNERITSTKGRVTTDA